jgi:Ni,Fe-hydrogenase III small subunit
MYTHNNLDKKQKKTSQVAVKTILPAGVFIHGRPLSPADIFSAIVMMAKRMVDGFRQKLAS